jgi:hypothetical protein
MDTKKYLSIIIMFLLYVLGLHAQTYSISAEVISSGGSSSTSASYTNFGVIGEAVVNHRVTGGNYETDIGFLQQVSTSGSNINERIETNAVKIYPNPVNHTLKIQINTPESFAINKLMLTNTLGVTVFEKTPAQENLVYTIDMSSYAPGVYHLLLYTNKGTVRRKILVVR